MLRLKRRTNESVTIIIPPSTEETRCEITMLSHSHQTSLIGFEAPNCQVLRSELLQKEEVPS